MIECQLPIGGAVNYTGKFYGYRIIVPATGASVRIDNGVLRPMFGGCDLFVARQGTDEQGRTIWFPWQSIQVTSGTNAPIYVRIAQSEDDVSSMGTSNIQPAFQEGDNIPSAISGLTPGPFGVVQMERDPVNVGKFVIPSAASVDASGRGTVIVVNPNLSRSISLYDTTTGAGAAQDTGPVGVSTGIDGMFIEIVFSGVLTGSRGLNIFMVRTDASQYTIFDPARDPAPTIAIGRQNYFAMFGQSAGDFFTSTTGPLDLSIGGIMMMGQSNGGAAGVRVTVAAGGAESVRIRILGKNGTIT